MNLLYDLIGSINDDSVLRLMSYIERQDQSIEHLQLNINSLGGDMPPAILAYNLLKKQPFSITTHNLGEVTSAAVLIYLAGGVRTSEKYSKFVMHPIKFTLNGPLSYNQIQEYLHSLDVDIANYASIVTQETDSLHGKYDIRECLKGSCIALDASSALTCGVVTQMI